MRRSRKGEEKQQKRTVQRDTANWLGNRSERNSERVREKWQRGRREAGGVETEQEERSRERQST